MARSSWRGAIELAGLPVNVALYNRTKSRSSDSFKTIAKSDGMPVKQQYVDTNGDVVEREDTHKGVMTGPDTFVVLTDAQVESIKDDRSEVVAPKQFVPKETLPIELALTAYAVTPDDKVPGSDKAAGIVWNGLLASGWAYVTDVVLTGGSRDSILAVYADDSGLWAVTLPYEVELNDVPSHDWEKDKAQAEAFVKFVEGTYKDELAKGFDHSAFHSAYRERREAAVSAALNGSVAVAPKKQAPASGVPDLMAVLTAGAGQARGGSSKAKATTKTKAKVK